MTVSDALEVEFDALVDAAIEILADRVADRTATRSTVRLRATLHAEHDREAFAALAADVAHAGRVTLTPRVLASLLAGSCSDPPAVPAGRPVLAPVVPRSTARPEGWLPEEAFRRCLAEARRRLASGDVG